MRLLVTGCYGFLGLHVALELKRHGHEVIGVDKLTNAVSEKQGRIDAMERAKALKAFEDVDLSNWEATNRVVKHHQPQAVVHIAAQYSVAYTVENLHRYIANNLQAFCYVLEACAVHKVKRLVYASSIAVPEDGLSRGLYAATKAFNEHAANAYAAKGRLRSVGLRYGVVYGPMCRKDSEVYRVARNVIDRHRPRMGGQYKTPLPFVEVTDAASITAMAVKAKIEQGHVVLPAYPAEPAAHYGHVLQIMSNALGVPALLPQGYQATPRGDFNPRVSLMQQALGWSGPKHTLETGIAAYVKWTRAYQDIIPHG